MVHQRILARHITNRHKRQPRLLNLDKRTLGKTTSPLVLPIGAGNRKALN